MISIEQLDQFGTLRATSGMGWDGTGLLSLNSLTIRSPQSGANNQRMDFSFIIITNTVLANVKYKAHNNYNYVFTILLTKQVINLLLPTCPDLMRRHSSGREQSGSVSVALFLLQCSPHLTLLQSSKVEKVNVGHKHQGYSRGAGVEWVLTSRSVSS